MQARWTSGPQDNRATSQELFTRWSFRVGERGVYLAARVMGDMARDSFTQFFDPRAPQQLGSVGPYFWLDGSFETNGKLKLKKGRDLEEAERAGLEGHEELAARLFKELDLDDLPARLRTEQVAA